MENPVVEQRTQARVSRIPNVRSMESFKNPEMSRLKGDTTSKGTSGRLRRRHAASLVDLTNNSENGPVMKSRVRPQPGILIQSRRASVIRRKSIDNSKLLDAHVAR